MSVRSLLSAVGGVVAASLREAFVRPVQSGRVSWGVWSTPMRVTVAGAYAVYALVVLGVLASPLVIGHDRPNAMGLSPWGAIPIAVGLWASMVLLFLASLNLHPLWRVGAWLLIIVPHTLTWLSGVMTATAAGIPLLGVLFGGMSVLLGVVILVVVVATGVGRPIRAVTVVLTTLAMVLSYLGPQLLSMRAPTIGSLGPVLTAILLTMLAMPLAVAAGTAFAQIAINLSTATLHSIRGRAPHGVWVVVAPVVGLLVLAMPLVRNADATAHALLITVGFTLVSTASSVLGLVLAHRVRETRHPGPAGPGAGHLRTTGDPLSSHPGPLALTEILADVSMVLGVLLGSWSIPLLLGMILPMPPLLKEHPAELSDFLMAAAALVLAVRAISRGRTAAAVLLPPIALMGLYAGLRGFVDLPTLQGSTAAATLAVVLGIVAVGWVRSGGGRHHWFVLSLALTILLVFPFREELAEPLEALLGDTQVGVLLVGLVWLLLTEAEFTHRGSPRFGRPARTLVFLAYALFTSAMMAAVAYGTDDSVVRRVHLGELANIGDAIIGYAVAPAVVVGLVALGQRDLDPVGRSPDPAGHRKVRS